MKLKIAVWHNLPSGGGKRALYYHVRGLLERGHQVEAWCPPTSNREYLPLRDLIPEHVLPIDIEPNRISRLIDRNPFLSRQVHYDSLREATALEQHCRMCAEQINDGGFDVLFANSSLYQAVSPIGKYVKCAKLLYLQEPNRKLYEAGPGGQLWQAIPSIRLPWLRPRYLIWFLLNLVGVQELRKLAREESGNARAFDSILVNSYFSRESLLRAYGLNSTVCYLGVDNQLFVNRGSRKEDFVVSMGEIAPHKNVQFIIRAIAEISQPRPRLIWIGNACHESYYEEMQRLAASCGVSFEARRNVSDSELVNILNRATLMAYAPKLEPFGFAPLEANACGLPVVAVAEGGVRETIVDGFNGLLVPADPPAMGAAIEKVFRDQDYAAELGRNGSQTVAKDWSIESAVTRLEKQLLETSAREPN